MLISDNTAPIRITRTRAPRCPTTTARMVSSVPLSSHFDPYRSGVSAARQVCICSSGTHANGSRATSALKSTAAPIESALRAAASFPALVLRCESIPLVRNPCASSVRAPTGRHEQTPRVHVRAALTPTATAEPGLATRCQHTSTIRHDVISIVTAVGTVCVERRLAIRARRA